MRDKLIALFVGKGYKGKEIVAVVKQILAIIDAQRCVWTYDRGKGYWSTGCGWGFPYVYKFDFTDRQFCAHCGHRIEVKEVKDAKGN